MPHSHIDVRYVANLARLELTPEEVATFQPQLEAILHHAEALSKLDVSGIEPTAHPAPVFDRCLTPVSLNSNTSSKTFSIRGCMWT